MKKLTIDKFGIALEFYKEESNYHYAHELRFYKATEMEMKFEEVDNV